jgi:hypothetical protein
MALAIGAAVLIEHALIVNREIKLNMATTVAIDAGDKSIGKRDAIQTRKSVHQSESSFRVGLNDEFWRHQGRAVGVGAR